MKLRSALERKTKSQRSPAKPIRVRLGARSYEVRVGTGLLSELGSFIKSMKDVTNVLVVTNAHVASYHIAGLESTLYKSKVDFEIHLVPDGEKAKSEEILFDIYHRLLRFRADRGSVMVAFGGGVVGDVAAFAASTFMRGIRLIQVPTTLLAQVDSAIGGKTGINLEEGKNLIGTFYQPSLVLCDISLLKTLPLQELSASLAEVIKYGVIKDEKFFSFLEKNVDKLITGDFSILQETVRTCAEIKADVVSRDEREVTGLRMSLNLGHTFAHAFERAAGYENVSHGRAVAVGLVAAAKLSEAKRMVKKDFTERLIALLKCAGLPTRLKDLDLEAEDVLEAMEHDKKKKKGSLRFVLPKGMGKLLVTDQVSPQLLKKVLFE